MYGFASPGGGGARIVTGSVPGAVADAAASGAWTGYLFGLVQVCWLVRVLLALRIRAVLLEVQCATLNVAHCTTPFLEKSASAAAAPHHHSTPKHPPPRHAECNKTNHKKPFPPKKDIDPSDGDIDALSLAYADESRTYGPGGAVASMSLQIRVYYAPTCLSRVADLKTGMVKYSLNVATGRSSMRLFVSSAGASSLGRGAAVCEGVGVVGLWRTCVCVRLCVCARGRRWSRWMCIVGQCPSAPSLTPPLT